MNNKIVLAVVGLVALVGAVALLANRPNPASAPTEQQQTTQTQQPTTVESTQVPSTETTGTMSANLVTETSAGFDPKTITIKTGEKVVWMNKSGVLGNVTSAIHPTHLIYPLLNLGDVADGGSVELTFPNPGTYKYHDHLNPTRFGSVVVE